MSEQAQKETEHPIFADDSNPTEVVTDPEKDTKGEPSQNPDARSLNRDRQVKSWSERIEKGEVSLDSIPDDMSWLKPLVKQELDDRSKRSDIEAIVKERIAAEKAEEAQKAQVKKAKDLKEKLKNLDLSDSDKKLMIGQYERFREKGMSEADALEEAMNVYDTLAKAGDKALSQMKEDMKIPATNKNVETEPEFGTEAFSKKGTSKDRVQKMEALLRANGRK